MRHIQFHSIDFQADQNRKKLLELILAILMLTGLIFLLEPFIDINVSVLISLIVLICAFVWGTYLGFSKHFLRELNNYRKTILDRKSTRLNSSHVSISYAVFCLKKKKTKLTPYHLVY